MPEIKLTKIEGNLEASSFSETDGNLKFDKSYNINTPGEFVETTLSNNEKMVIKNSSKNICVNGEFVEK